MVIFLFLLILLSVYQIRFNSFNTDYLDVCQTTAIKGIFAVIIFLSHERNYLLLNNGIGDTLFRIIIETIGQTMVVMFLFYSGYGVMESYKHKPDYEKHFFKNRILKTLIHFDLAVFLYMFLNMILGKKYPLIVNLFSLLGWASIGNSNWFICVILMLYLLTLAAFFLDTERKSKKVAFMILLFSIILWIILDKSSKPAYWYNTLMSYSAGAIFSVYKSRIDKFMKNNLNYCIVFGGLSALVLLCGIIRGGTITFSIFSLIISLLIVFVTMKAKIDNVYLNLLGKYSFSIYILHRIPMIILSEVGINNSYVFTVLSFLFSCILAYGFSRVLRRIDRILMKIK